MQVVVATHGHGFRGLASAGVFTRLLQQIGTVARVVAAELAG